MAATYTYHPENIGADGRDRMRFELGDVMTEGGGATCALSDAEYDAILKQYPGKWKRAKLALVENLLRRFDFEVDTDVGPLSLGLRARADAWRQLYRELKADVSAASSNPGSAVGGSLGRPYFRQGMHDNPTFGGTEGMGPYV